jgi:hypothetical protein
MSKPDNIVTLPVIRIERCGDEQDEFSAAASNLVSDYVDDYGAVPDADRLEELITHALRRARQGGPIYG